MTHEMFRGKLVKELKKRLPDAMIKPQDLRKNNGVVLSGIIIKGESNMAPTIYTEGLFYEFQYGGKNMDAIVDSVIDLYERFKPEYDFDVSQFAHFSKARWKLQGKLVNTEKNGELLEDMPHRDFFDLSLIYQVDVAVKDQDNGCASIQVMNSHMETWGVTEEDLFRQVRENMEQHDDSLIVNMREILSEMKKNLPDCECLELKEDVPYIPMYVLSNSRKVNGAAEILNEKALDKAAELLGDDFYILPSSVHETILVPVIDNEADTLADMVREINGIHVGEMDVLSDHVYRYNRDGRKIELAA